MAEGNDHDAFLPDDTTSDMNARYFTHPASPSSSSSSSSSRRIQNDLVEPNHNFRQHIMGILQLHKNQLNRLQITSMIKSKQYSDKFISKISTAREVVVSTYTDEWLKQYENVTTADGAGVVNSLPGQRTANILNALNRCSRTRNNRKRLGTEVLMRIRKTDRMREIRKNEDKHTYVLSNTLTEPYLSTYAWHQNLNRINSYETLELIESNNIIKKFYESYLRHMMPEYVQDRRVKGGANRMLLFDNALNVNIVFSLINNIGNRSNSALNIIFKMCKSIHLTFDQLVYGAKMNHMVGQNANFTDVSIFDQFLKHYPDNIIDSATGHVTDEIMMYVTSSTYGCHEPLICEYALFQLICKLNIGDGTIIAELRRSYDSSEDVMSVANRMPGLISLICANSIDSMFSKLTTGFYQQLATLYRDVNTYKIQNKIYRNNIRVRWISAMRSAARMLLGMCTITGNSLGIYRQRYGIHLASLDFITNNVYTKV